MNPGIAIATAGALIAIGLGAWGLTLLTDRIGEAMTRKKEQRERDNYYANRRKSDDAAAAKAAADFAAAALRSIICNPSAGDIGEERKHIELEPLEAPSTVPATVPAQEPVPA